MCARTKKGTDTQSACALHEVECFNPFVSLKTLYQVRAEPHFPTKTVIAFAFPESTRSSNGLVLCEVPYGVR